MTNPVYDVDSFQGRDDDVVLNSATFNGGGGADGDWTQDTDVNFRIRYLVQETAGGMGNNKLLQLAYDKNFEGFTDVNGSSSNVQSSDSIQYADNATTTQVIGGGTYVTGESLGGDDTDGITGNIDFAGSDEVEIEFCVQIIGADVDDEDTIVFQIRDGAGGSALPETVSLTITVNKAAATGRIMCSLANAGGLAGRGGIAGQGGGLAG